MRGDIHGMVLIMIAALAIVALGVIIIGNLAYQTPPLLQEKWTNQSYSIKWGEAYNLAVPSRYKYEVISIANGVLNRTTALYSKSWVGDFVRVDFVTFNGVNPTNSGAGVLVKKSDYKCISKYYKSAQIPCNSDYEDYESQLAAQALPTIMDSREMLQRSDVGSAVYGGRLYEAVKLTSQDGKIAIWVIEGLPLPVRIEIHGDGALIIANLKSVEQS